MRFSGDGRRGKVVEKLVIEFDGKLAAIFQVKGEVTSTFILAMMLEYIFQPLVSYFEFFITISIEWTFNCIHAFRTVLPGSII